IVPYDPLIGNGKIMIEQIFQAAMKSPANVPLGDVMTSFFDALFDTGDRFGWIGNPKIMKLDFVSTGFRILEESKVSLAANGGFQGEAFPFFNQPSEFLQKQAASPDC